MTVITTWIIATGSEQKISAEFNSCLLGPQRIKHFAISHCGTNNPRSLDMQAHGPCWQSERRGAMAPDPALNASGEPSLNVQLPGCGSAPRLTTPFTATYQAA